MKHKRGDTFDYIVTLPPSIADGELAGWVPTCQIRDLQDALISDVVTDWVDPQTARSVSLHVSSTQAWPIGSAVFDIQFKRPFDSYILSTWTKRFSIVMDVTRP